jgi:hypothetical protein
MLALHGKWSRADWLLRADRDRDTEMTERMHAGLRDTGTTVLTGAAVLRASCVQPGAGGLGGACRKPRKDGGRDRDRTCDPYHVKVVLFR